MLMKVNEPTSNVYCGVEYILRGAKKRRSMALANAKALSNEVGIQTKLTAVK